MIKYLMSVVALLMLVVPAHAIRVDMDSEADERAAIRQGGTMHFTDTLDTAKEIRQFEEALVIAPKAFVCQSCKQEPGVVTFISLRMNPTIDNVIETPIVQSDPSLERKFRRIGRITHIFFGACDLKVSYSYLPNGHISVAYDISRIRFFVFR